MRRILLLASLLLTSTFAHAEQVLWVRTNGPYGGKVNDLAVDSHGHFFAATDYGVFRSTNGGQDWTRVNNNLSKQTSLIINTVVATSNGMIFVGSINGVFYSLDDGQRWISAGIDHLKVRKLFVNSEGHIFGVTPNLVFWSTDNGASWLSSSVGLSLNSLNCVVVNPSGVIFAGTELGVYRSTDRGKSWVEINKLYWVNAMSLDSENNIYAASNFGVYISTDNGNSWRSSIFSGSFSIATTQTGLLFFGGTTGVYKSTDKGNRWTLAVRPQGATWVRSLAVRNDGTILAGTQGEGIFRSTDWGQTWVESSSGLTAMQINALLVDYRGNIFAASTFGVFRSTNEGLSWKRVLFVPYSRDYNSFALDQAGNILVGGLNVGIYRSEDGGNSWTRINPASTDSFFLCLAVSPRGTIFAGTPGSGILRSTDNGKSWQQTNNGIRNTYILSIQASPTGPIYAGCAPELYQSTNDGASWQQIYKGFFNTNFSALVSSPSNYIFAGSRAGDGIYRSRTDKNEWQRVFVKTGLPYDPTYINAMAISINGNIFASHNGYPGVPGSIMRSTDNGNSWIELNDGGSWSPVAAHWQEAVVPALAVHPKGFLLAGTVMNGVYKTQMTVVGPDAPKAPPLHYVLEQNYPNPFNVGTTIRFALPRPSHVELYIYNTLGARVMTLLTGNYPTGEHSVHWNSEGFASGVYLYRLRADNYVQTKKLVLVK